MTYSIALPDRGVVSVTSDSEVARGAVAWLLTEGWELDDVNLGTDGHDQVNLTGEALRIWLALPCQ